MKQDFLESRIDGYAHSSLDATTSKYIDSYWIDRRSLDKDWAHLLGTVFIRSSGKVSFPEGKHVDLRQGGILFTEPEFSTFVRQSKGSGAERFAVVEDVGQGDWKALTDLSFLRFSYPLDIQWNELTRSSLLAKDVFDRPIRAFFVVTDNGRVGKYTDNDADSPYDLVFHD